MTEIFSATDMNTKHTPGPWTVKLLGTVQAESQSIAECYGLNERQRSANAELIAAAPFMLLLLQDLTSYDSMRKAYAKESALNLLSQFVTHEAGDHSTMAGDYGRTLAGDYDLFGDANKMATEGSAFPSVNTNT